MPAKIPKDLIGIKGLKQLAKNATLVVEEVTAIALTALLNEQASLFFLSERMFESILSLCLHASINTNMSSAAIPRTMKITKVWRLLKYVTYKIPSVMQTVIGKLSIMSHIPTVARNNDFKLYMRQKNTKKTEKILQAVSVVTRVSKDFWKYSSQTRSTLKPVVSSSIALWFLSSMSVRNSLIYTSYCWGLSLLSENLTPLMLIGAPKFTKARMKVGFKFLLLMFASKKILN